MTEISFYHLTVRPLEWALPKLLERSLESGARALVKVSSEARLDALNAHLWTYSLIHGFRMAPKKMGMGRNSRSG